MVAVIILTTWGW